MKTLFAASTFALVVAAPAFAGVQDPGIQHRERHEARRIDQGIRSGELTRGEARMLRTQQRFIRQEEREFKADGRLTRAERRELRRDLDEASRDIRREKHDGERR